MNIKELAKELEGFLETHPVVSSVHVRITEILRLIDGAEETWFTDNEQVMVFPYKPKVTADDTLSCPFCDFYIKERANRDVRTQRVPTQVAKEEACKTCSIKAALEREDS